MKTAVVLFNLGGPDSKEAIEPFLMNFFTDRNIIDLPYPLRWFVAKMISKRRSKREAGDSYAFLGDRSPLLENTAKQAALLENELSKSGEFKVFVSMRYWHPMAKEVVAQVKKWGADRIVLVPLYPQFSTTTTKSSFETWQKEADKQGLNIATSKICCYPTDHFYTESSARKILDVYKKAQLENEGKAPRILFSAHGLPEKIIEAGDPYQWQCEQSAQEIIKATGLQDVDWQICYQSRVGPLRWIEPSTEEALEKAAHDAVPVVIYPHAFTQEHVETLVEIDIEYREFAKEKGLTAFYKVDTLGDDKSFVAGLSNTILALGDDNSTAPVSGQRLCPAGYRKCPCGV